MQSIILNIRANYNQLGPGEKKIADLILAEPRAILPLTITEFSEKAGCGNATLVRFAKRLGMNGYQDLKIAIAQDVSSLSNEKDRISKNDNVFNIFFKRSHDIQVALQETCRVLDKNALEEAAKKIMHANRIVIFGLGNSSPVALDAQHKFLRLGLNAVACSDNHLQAIISSHLDKGSVAIGISHSGHSADIISALKLSKISGATTICLTNYGTPPITKYSDICLFTQAAETQHSILAMSSRIAQLTILDALYTYILAQTEDTSLEAIVHTESALKEKKV